MRLFLALSLILSSIPVHADWGRGLYRASDCNQDYEPAPQSYAAADELSNVRGQISQDRRALSDREAQLRGIDSRVASARGRMSQVLSPQGVVAVDEHYNQRRDVRGYRKACGPADAGQANLAPVPEAFCQPNADGDAVWKDVLDHDNPGRADGVICDFYIPPQGERSVPDADKRTCRQGLADYYAALDEKSRLNQEINDLQARLNGSEARIGRINTEVAEGRYCATCNSQRRGYSTNSTGDQMMDMVGPLVMMGALLMASSQRRSRPQPPPYGPPMMPYGGGGVPYRAFPARAYAAPVRGYYGMHNGVYGAVPGSIGRGAFACNNTSPLSFGDPMFGNDLASIYGDRSPFDAPYAAPFMNPGAQNRMCNPGFGPAFRPVLGGNGAFGRPGMPFARNAPAMLSPMRGRMPVTQMNQRFGQIPGTMFGQPAPGIFQGGAPAFLNYQQGRGIPGMPLQYGAPQFAGVNPLAGNSMLYGGNNFYSAPAIAGYRGGPLTSVSNVPGLTTNVLGNYNYQMGQISQNIQLLGSGTYYAPPSLPYQTGGGLTTLPGTTVLPAVGAPPTSIPSTGTGTAAPGVVTPVKKK